MLIWVKARPLVRCCRHLGGLVRIGAVQALCCQTPFELGLAPELSPVVTLGGMPISNSSPAEDSNFEAIVNDSSISHRRGNDIRPQ